MELEGVNFKVTAETGQLEQAEAEVQKFAREADEAQKSVDKFGTELTQADKSAGRFIDSTGRMREKTGEYIKTTDKAAESAENLSAGLGDAGGSARRLTADLSTLDAAAITSTKSLIVLAGAAGAYTVALSNNVKEQQAWADAVGVSLQTLQGWGAAAQTVGRDVGYIGDVFKDANEKIGDFVATGGGEAADVFEQLNIQAAELKNLSPDQQLLRIAAGLENVQTRGEKLFILESLANDASLLLPLLEDNARGLKEVTDQAERLGVVISDADAAALREVSQEWTELTQTISGFGNTLATQYAGDVAGFLDSAASGIQSLTMFIDENGNALRTTGALLSGAVAGYTAYVAATKAATLATNGFNLALAANPVGLLARGLAVAGGALATYMALKDDMTASENENTQAIYGNIGAIATQSKEVRESAIASLELRREQLQAELDQRKAETASFQQRIKEISALRDAYGQTAENIALYNQSILNLALTQENSVEVQEQLTQQLADADARIQELRDTFTTTIPAIATLNSETEKTVRTYRELRGVLDPVQRAYNGYYDLVQDIADSSSTVAEKTELMAIAYAYLRDELDGLKPDLEDVKDEIDEQIDQADPYAKAWEEATKRIDDSFASAWEGAFDSFESFADSLLDSFKRMLAEMAHQATTKKILVNLGFSGSGGTMSSGSGGFDINNILSSGSTLRNAYGMFTGEGPWYDAVSGFLGMGAGGVTTAAGYGSFASALPNTAGYLGMGVGQTTATSALQGLGGTATSTAGAAGSGAAGGMSAFTGAGIVAAIPLIGSLISKYFGQEDPRVTLASMSQQAVDEYNAAVDARLLELAGSQEEGSASAARRLALEQEIFGASATTTPFGVLGVSGTAHGGGDANYSPILEAAAEVDRQIASLLSDGEVAKVTDAMSNWTFNAWGKTSTKVSDIQDQLSMRLDAQLNAINGGLADFVDAIGNEIEGDAAEDFAQRVGITQLALSMRDTIDIASIGAEAFRGMAYEGELLGDAVIRTLSQLEYMQQQTEALGLTFEGAGEDLLIYADNIVKAAGGIESLQVATASYYDNFFTDAEKLDNLTSQLNDTFSDLGLELPNTREGFRAIVEGLDLTTQAGQEMYATLLNLNPQVAEYIAGLESVGSVMDRLMGRADSALSGVMSAIGAERDALSDRYNSEREAILANREARQDQLDAERDAFKELERSYSALDRAFGRMNMTDSASIFNRAAGATAFLRGAVASGGIPSAEELEPYLAAAQEPTEELFSSFEDYARQFFITKGLISELRDRAGSQLTTDEKALQNATKFYDNQLDALEQQYKLDLEALDQQAEEAQSLYDAVTGVNDGILSVVEAIHQLEASLADVLAGSAGSGGTFGNITDQSGSDVRTIDIEGDPIVEAYNRLFGRDPDVAGYRYWAGMLESGAVGAGSLDDFIMGGARGIDVPGFANGGMHSGGLRIVGERGLELEYTGPSRIMSNSDLMSAISGGADTARAVKNMEQSMMAGFRAVEKNTREIKQLQRRWDQQGLPETRDFSALDIGASV